MKVALTYPVAIVASVLILCFTAIIVVSLSKGQDLQTVLGAVGVLLTLLGGIYAQRKVTPLERPRNAEGTPLVPDETPQP